MRVKTNLFGDMDIEDEKIICFPDGMIGFPDRKRFTLIADEKEDRTSHIYWLQSIEEEAFAIPLMNPLLVKEDYNPEVEDDLLSSIGGLKEDGISVFVTVTVPAQIEHMSVNLKAPLIINMDTMKACQLILDGEQLSVRYPIYDILKSSKAGD